MQHPEGQRPAIDTGVNTQRPGCRGRPCRSLGPFPPDGPAPQDTGTKAQIRKGFLVHALDDGPLRPSSPPISRMLMCQCTVRRAAHSITIVRDETSVWQFQNVVEKTGLTGEQLLSRKNYIIIAIGSNAKGSGPSPVEIVRSQYGGRRLRRFK